MFCLIEEISAELRPELCRYRMCRSSADIFPLAPNQMPSLRELERRNYFISVTSHGGDEEYISRRRIYFNSDSFGFIMVKTDKPIYKPEQSGSGVLYNIAI